MLQAACKMRLLRAEWVRTKRELLRRLGPQLAARGFNLALPDTIEIIIPEQLVPDAIITVTQEDPPGRLPRSHPQLTYLCARLARGDQLAIGELGSLLMAEGDDRYDVFEKLEVAMPEQCEVYADFGTRGDAHSDERVDGEKMAVWLLCQKCLLLMGAKQELME